MVNRQADGRLALTDPTQFKALGHPVRWRILGLLHTGRDATVTQLAATLQRSKGSVGHHVTVLAAAGLIVCRAPSGYAV